MKSKYKKMFLMFKRLFHEKEPAVFQLFSKDKAKANKCRIVYGTLKPPLLEDLLNANEDGLDLGVVINRSANGGRKRSDIKEIAAFFVDFDDGNMTLKKLMNLPVRPDAVCESSPGHLHAYWLTKHCPVEAFPRAQEVLATLLGGDKAVTDASRVMRGPGTLNWKRAKACRVKLLYINKDARAISARKFMKKMNLDVTLVEGGSAPENARLHEAKVKKEVIAEIEAALDKIPPENRWVWLQAGMAIHSALPNETGKQLWWEWAEKSSKFDAKDQARTWSRFKVNGDIKLGTLFFLANDFVKKGEAALDEFGLAPMYAETFKDRLRYVLEQKTWYTFTGVIWTPDQQAPVRAAREFILNLSSGKDVPKELRKFRTAANFRALVSHVELLPAIHAKFDLFDANRNLLGVENGVVDLVSGEYRIASPTDYLLRKCPVVFDQTAECPIWQRFIQSVTENNAPYARFLQQAFGYTAFGHANLQVFFTLIGDAQNGKGVLLRTLQAVLGDYALSVAPNLLTSAYSNNANSPSPALAALCGARLVCCTELPDGKKFDAAFVKQFAGGDEINARHGYGNMFAFKPEGKIWISTNHIPEVAVDDKAMWRRLVALPFKGTFEGENRDNFLEVKLEKEYAGILNWLVAGAMQFAQSGQLPRSKVVRSMQKFMRRQADSVEVWIEEKCRIEDGMRSASSLAYESYCKFTRSSDRKPISNPAFVAAICAKGFEHRRRNDGNYIVGLRVKS